MATKVPPINKVIFLSLLLIISTFLQPSLSEFCNALDKIALLDIKTQFKNPSILASWDPNTDCCYWTNVLCEQKDYRVYSLSFSYGDLAGPIPPQVGDLSFLQLLNFHKYPKITGSIPATIGQLGRLRFLQITWTGISGPIPDVFATVKSLEFIDFSYNSISGTIPASIGYLPGLGGLRLDRNNLVGPIPASFGEFKAADFYMYLSHNQLSGTIPASLSKLRLSYIDLSRNKLVGDPAPLFGWEKTTQLLDLSRNKFAFDLTNVRFPKRLVSLDLNHNKMTGSIPAEVTQLRLTLFNVSYNRLCGKIPYSGSLLKFGYSEFFHNKCLCGPPLGNTCNSLPM